MPYLNLDLNYEDHPKTRRLIALLGPESDIYPIRLWLYCGKVHPKDGHMRGYAADELEAAIRWSGPKNKAVKALVTVGFLKRVASGYICVDWRQHQGHLEAFSRRGKLANKVRWERVRKASLKDTFNNPPTVPTIPTVPYHTEPTVPSQAKHSSVDSQSESERLLQMPWKVAGDYYLHAVRDLPVDYCHWALNGGLTNIGDEYRQALRSRIELKKSEMTH